MEEKKHRKWHLESIVFVKLHPTHIPYMLGAQFNGPDGSVFLSEYHTEQLIKSMFTESIASRFVRGGQVMGIIKEKRKYIGYSCSDERLEAELANAGIKYIYNRADLSYIKRMCNNICKEDRERIYQALEEYYSWLKKDI